MLDSIRSYWRGLVGTTQKNTNYIPVSGRRFGPTYDGYNNPTYKTCIELLARSMSNIKYRVYDSNNKEDCSRTFTKVFSVKANQWHTTAEFLRIMERNRLVYGDAYAYIKWAKDGTLAELIPLNPAHMRVLLNDTLEILESDIIYEYADGHNTYTFLPDELIHVRANSHDGIKGIGSAEALYNLLKKTGLADRYLDEIMENGYGGVMTLECVSDLNTERAKQLMSQVKEVLKAQGNRMLAIPPGIKASILGPVSIDTATLDMNDELNKEIAAYFGIPLFLLNKEGGNGTAGMTSAQASAFYNFVLAPIVNIYVAEFSAKLLTNSQINHGVHFDNYDISGFGLLNANERVDNYVKLCAGGILTCNEVRKELGFQPYKDEFDSGNKIYRNGAFTSGDNGDSTGSKEEDITKRDNTVKNH